MRLQVSGSEADLHEVEGAKIHIVRNADLEGLLFNRNLIGADFRKACLASSRNFIRHIADEYDPDSTAELVLLSKGLMYQLGEAVCQEVNQNLPTNLMATSRVAVSGGLAKVEVSYAQIEAPASTLFIGDTVASGGTIVEAVRTYLDSFELRRLYVFSYAGAKVGAIKIAEFCKEHSIDCTLVYGLAAFGLGDNGFDLSFLHPDTITREEYRERAHLQFSGRPVSAVGWDFGSQAMSPSKYRRLSWVEAEVWGLQGEECFSVAERPVDLSELAHERAAYEHQFVVPE